MRDEIDAVLAFLEIGQRRPPRVLVVGDLMRDVDVSGRCDRYAPEAAGCPVFAEESREERPGGAGAVAAMAAALGAAVELLSGPVASVKTRYFADGRQLWRHDADARPLTAPEAADLADRVRAAAPNADAVLVADHGKGACGYAAVRAAIVGAAPCVVNPARNVDWRTYRGALAVKCNRAEWDHASATLGAGRSGGWWEHHVENVVVTAGPDGMTHYPRRKSAAEYPARPRTVRDVTGCGDMVLAALGVCLAAGADWPDACRVANAAAGLKVERRGAVPVPRADVVADLLGGAAVVFVNGCFDGLHAGHARFLRAAGELVPPGGVLVAGLNSDESVRRLKGPARPRVPEADRRRALEGLGCRVVVFDADTPAGLVRELRPAVLVKGTEYAPGGRPCPEADVVRGYGGRVAYLPRTPGVSTTERACVRDTISSHTG